MANTRRTPKTGAELLQMFEVSKGTPEEDKTVETISKSFLGTDNYLWINWKANPQYYNKITYRKPTLKEVGEYLDKIKLTQPDLLNYPILIMDENYHSRKLVLDGQVVQDGTLIHVKVTGNSTSPWKPSYKSRGPYASHEYHTVSMDDSGKISNEEAHRLYPADAWNNKQKKHTTQSSDEKPKQKKEKRKSVTPDAHHIPSTSQFIPGYGSYSFSSSTTQTTQTTSSSQQPQSQENKRPRKENPSTTSTTSGNNRGERYANVRSFFTNPTPPNTSTYTWATDYSSNHSSSQASFGESNPNFANSGQRPSRQENSRPRNTTPAQQSFFNNQNSSSQQSFFNPGNSSTANDFIVDHGKKLTRLDENGNEINDFAIVPYKGPHK